MANPARVLSRVSSVTAFGEGIYEVTFSTPSRYTRYRPGQFLHLTLDAFDPSTGYWPESRVFSIAAEPRQEYVSIVYSVRGSYTKRMEQELHPGKEVWLKFPYGDFVIADDLLEQGPVVLIAGGTGVSPYRPFLKAQSDRTGEVHLFYGVRRPEHVLFTDDLTMLSEFPWFHLHLMVEDGKTNNLPMQKGRLSIDLVVRELGTSMDKSNFFLSGPPAMIQAFKQDLLTKNISARQIHIDEWE